MALPIAYVRVTLERLVDVDPAPVRNANRPFAVARIGPRGFGRRYLRAALGDAADGSLRLHGAETPYQFEFAARVEQDIPIGVFLWDERSPVEPAALGAFQGVIPAPWTANRLILADARGPITLECSIEITRIARVRRVAAVPRTAPGIGRAVPVALSDAREPMLVVTLPEILGLRRPRGSTMDEDPHRPQSRFVRGYTSEDDRGRIFLEHDVNGNWKANVQAIELTAEVTAIATRIPADAQIRWTVFNPDDLSNDGSFDTFGPLIDEHPPAMDQAWRGDIDPNDYGVPTRLRHEAMLGSRDDGDDLPERESFVAIEGFPLTTNPDSDSVQTQTPVVGGRSRVRVNAPARAGATMIVRAEIVSSSSAQVIPAQTGVMTLWHAIRVEVHQMEGTRPSPLDSVNVLIQPAFIQMDFQRPIRERSRPDFGRDIESSYAALDRFTERNFRHRGQGGWFYLLIARRMFPVATDNARITGVVPLMTGQSAAVPMRSPDGRVPIAIDYVEYAAPFPDAGTVELFLPRAGLAFGVAHQESTPSGGTRVFLEPHDIQDRFDAGDGSGRTAYAHTIWHYLTGRLDQTWEPGARGYGLQGVIQGVLRSDPMVVAGISPTILVDQESYFAGRTVLFDADSDPFRDIASLAHEFVHAFGLPHKCGYLSFDATRVLPASSYVPAREHRTGCLMNYQGHGYVDDRERRTITPMSLNGNDSALCGKHIRELRRTVLSRNRGLGWVPDGGQRRTR